MSIKGAVIAVVLTYLCGSFIAHDLAWVLCESAKNKEWARFGVIWGFLSAALLGALAPELMSDEGGE